MQKHTRYYEILGVSPVASTGEIKAGTHALAVFLKKKKKKNVDHNSQVVNV